MQGSGDGVVVVLEPSVCTHFFGGTCIIYGDEVVTLVLANYDP